MIWDGDGYLVAGHGRLLAAQQLGLASVPVHRIGADEITASQAAAYRIADNKSAEGSTWDDALLLAELEALDERERLDAGFAEAEIAELRRRYELENLVVDPAEDEVPEPLAQPISRRGDLWLLGEHRLLCGDAMKREDVERIMGDAKADMVFTDPPYGVSYHGSSKSGSIAGDLSQTAIPIAFKHALDYAATEDARLYFCGGSSNVLMYYSLFDAYLRSMPSLIIWDKGHFVMRRNNYHSQYEIVFYGWRGSGGANEFWFGPRTADAASDVWLIKRDPANEYLHSTQKPVALAQRAITNSSPPDGVVYEPFAGSGSTLIAAEAIKRRCCAIELEPAMVDVVMIRWQNFTGKLAVHAETGEPFNGRAAA